MYPRPACSRHGHCAVPTKEGVDGKLCINLPLGHAAPVTKEFKDETLDGPATQDGEEVATVWGDDAEVWGDSALEADGHRFL